MRFLRANTACNVAVGPFIDTADGFTPITSITHANVSCELWTLSSATDSRVSITVDTTTGASTNQLVGSGTQGMWRLHLKAANITNLGRARVYLRSTTDTFYPVWHDFMIVDDDIHDWLFGTTTTILDRIGSIAGTGNETLVGLLKAVMSMSAAIPTGLGTYNTATDSLEALRDHFDDTVAPQVVAAPSGSGSGFLSEAVSQIRQTLDEPSTNPKYSNSDIIRVLQSSMATVLADLHSSMDHKILVRLPIQVEADVQTYVLPPQVAQVWSVSKIDANGTKLYDVYVGSEHDFTHTGFRLEGNTIRLMTTWTAGETLQVTFVPTVESTLCKGTSTDYDTNTIVLETITDGTLDTRPNAYAGYMLRILSSTNANANYMREYIITDYDPLTSTATVNVDFDPVLAGTVTWEVIPMGLNLFKEVAVIHAAMTLAGMEGREKKMMALERLSSIRMRALRIQLSRKEQRRGRVMEGRTIDNSDYALYLW